MTRTFPGADRRSHGPPLAAGLVSSLIALTAAVLAPMVSSAQQTAIMTISSTNLVVRTPAELTVTVRIQNFFSNAVALSQPACAPQAFQVKLTDSTGTELPLADEAAQNGPGGGVRSLYQIGPGQALACELNVTIPTALAPGHYNLHLERWLLATVRTNSASIDSDKKVVLRSNPLSVSVAAPLGQPSPSNQTVLAANTLRLGQTTQDLRTLPAAQTNLVPLYFSLPLPVNGSVMVDIQPSDHLEPRGSRRRPPLLVPPGVTNLALHRPVSSSDTSPVRGRLQQLTDGVRGHEDRTDLLVLHGGVQWVQVDLQSRPRIYAVVVWHAKWPPKVVHKVVVQLSDDPKFQSEVRTLFNNDYGNELGLGVGTDKEYYESIEGRLIDAKGASDRFLRLYSAGSTEGPENTYLALEVYGLP